jgi:hypothetical protein
MFVLNLFVLNLFVLNLLCTRCTNSLHPYAYCTQKVNKKAKGALAPTAPVVPASLRREDMLIYNKSKI